MQSLYRISFFLFGCFFVQLAHAQTQPQTQPLLRDTVINPVQRDTTGLMPLDTVPVTSLSPELLNIYNQTAAKKYKIADIKVTGNNYFDQNLLLSIAGLNVGDEVAIPGGDNFSRAINKLWSQNYFSDVAIYLTAVKDDNIWVEVHVTERPRLSNYTFKGVKKSEIDDLKPKTGLVI